MHYLSKIQNIDVVIASASRQRSAILTQLGIIHSVLPTHMKEHTREVQPQKIVCDLAEQKAQRGVQLYMSKVLQAQEIRSSPLKKKEQKNTPKNARTALVIGADTIVWCKDTCYGKPTSKSHARSMLHNLSGNTHHVYSGVSVVILEYDFVRKGTMNKTHTCFDCCKVTFSFLKSEEIEDYLATDEWRNVAGAYAIQGVSACFIKSIDGLYSTVVGLPIKELCDTIEKIL